MALFGGKGVPTSLLVALAAVWAYDVAVTHLGQITAGYPGEKYSVEHGVIVEMHQPRWWMVGHAAVGIPVFFMWLAQASQEVRKWSYAFHRWNGRLSLVLWLPFGIFTPIRAFNMSQTEKTMETFTRFLISTFGMLVISWVVVGWVAIAVWKNVGLHRQCMIRALVGAAAFIILSRKGMWLLKAIVLPGTGVYAWWWDIAVWVLFPIALGLTEGLPYLMEKSFQTPWEYRLLGFVRLWSRPQRATNSETKALPDAHEEATYSPSSRAKKER